jgi:hypothetical protein
MDPLFRLLWNWWDPRHTQMLPCSMPRCPTFSDDKSSMTAQPALNTFEPLSHPSGTANIGSYFQNIIIAQLPPYYSENMTMSTRSGPSQALTLTNPLNVVVIASQNREELPPAYNEISVSNAVEPAVVVETPEETNIQSDV